MVICVMVSWGSVGPRLHARVIVIESRVGAQGVALGFMALCKG